MSLTEEQIKNLKPGDTIIIHGTFVRIATDGDIVAKCPLSFMNKYSCSCYCLHPTCCHLPPEDPKYDPKRLFKKGDRVRIVEYKGRSFTKHWEKRIGQILTVTLSEDDDSTVGVDNQVIDPAYLELVTPVEELNPYSVLETDTINGFDIMRDGLCVMTFPYGSKEAGYYRDEIGAKEAAEAECKRLNDEHRKKQNL